MQAAMSMDAPGFSPSALLDDPEEWAAFGRALPAAEGVTAPGRWQSQVVIEGMHCAACAFNVEAALLQVPGVQAVQVNAASRRARVTWSAAQVLPSRWFAASAAAGYRLMPANDVGQRAERQRSARQALWRWLVAGLCMMQVMMYAYPEYTAAPGDMTASDIHLMRWASWVLSLPVLLFSCGPFFANAWRDLRHRRIGMDLPVALGLALTFVVSSAGTFDPAGPLGQEVYFDSFTMFVFFLLTGRWLEARLRERTAGALEALMHRLPDSIERKGADGRFTRVALRRLKSGDVVRVRPGEAFPADGQVIEGDTSADEALLTGESRPVPRPCGASVLAGSHNLTAVVLVRIASVGAATRFAQIVQLMESASVGKPRLAQLADRIARPFLAVVLGAAALAFICWWPVDPARALMAAAVVLIVTCPCALSLATPAALLASAGSLARGGVLVRNLQALEALAGIDTLVFDKTGTLTRDTPRLERVFCRAGLRPGDALALAATLAEPSLHPASRALVQAWQAQHPGPSPWHRSSWHERAGQGVEALLQGVSGPVDLPGRMRLGSARFCEVPPLQGSGVQVHLSDAQGWVASFQLSEALRPEARATVQALQAEGIAVRLLSGDRTAAAQDIATQAGITEARGDCLPEDKLAVVKQLQAQGHRVAMVGDGLNDGPVLARADASFAFGRAVPLTQARADFIVLADDLGHITRTLLLARRALRVVRQNLLWAALYNALCIPLALAGWIPAWLAGLGMALSSLAVVLNAARLAKPLMATESAPATQGVN